MSSSPIQHVSDTAIWVAYYRALETNRRDAVFKDPLAAKLTAERGRLIAEAMPAAKALHFIMATRTTAIDRLIESALARGVDTVINLGAGLDTRPYRMKLPSSLRWVEADFAHVIAFKEKCLAVDQPVCRLERVTIDLGDEAARKALLTRLGAESKKALVITEGVIPYLTNEHASALSRDLFAVPTFQFWIQDYRRGKEHRWAAKVIAKKMQKAPFSFTVPEPLPYFARDGWTVDQNIKMLDEANRIGRKMPFLFPWSLMAFLKPGAFREHWNQSYGFVMFTKA